MNLAKGTAKRLLENLINRIVPMAEALVAKIEAENAQLIAVRPELSRHVCGRNPLPSRHPSHVVIKGTGRAAWLKDRGREIVAR